MFQQITFGFPLVLCKALFWFVSVSVLSVFLDQFVAGSSLGPCSLQPGCTTSLTPSRRRPRDSGPGWARLMGGLAPGSWAPLLGLALGTAALLSGPGRRRTGLPVRKSERFSSRCLASSPTRDASQQHDCPFVFKRGTVRFLKSLIYS